ncbi:MAG TPA: PEP-CTERM sorting domain-containing protein [Bryobacteraceae bacterium]|nr:PEP-CTERM sorting domain-containing protein [Bryobacteraceae bacterium]HXJ41821.1 PEP-CTERM sorting domain-containing protein [Bryobacteraceae bacterium]
MDAASRVANLAEDLDTELADTWHLAFPERGSDHDPAASTSHKDGSLDPVANVAVTEVADILPSGIIGTGSNDANSFGTGSFIGSFNAGNSAGSAPNSIAGLLSDMLKDDNSWAGGHMGFEALAGSLAGAGNARAPFGSSVYASLGPSNGGIALAGFSRAAEGSAQSFGENAPSFAQNVEGKSALAAVNPNAHNAYLDAHQERVATMEGRFGSVSDTAGASANQVGSQVGSSGAPGGLPSAGTGKVAPTVAAVSRSGGSSRGGGAGNANPTAGINGGTDSPVAAGTSRNQGAAGGTISGPLSAAQGNTAPIEGSGSSWNGASHDGGADNAITTADPAGQLLSGLDHPLQGDDHLGSVSPNAVNNDASGSSDGTILDFNNPPVSDFNSEDHGSTDKLVGSPDPDPGIIATVPEPGSLMLLSLALGAVILWRRFLSAQ